MYTPNCDVFWVGSYPAKDAMSASRRVLKHDNVMLHWPQLPKRSRKERPIDQTYAALATKDDDFATGSAAGWNAMWRLLKSRPKVWIKRTHFKTHVMGPVTLFGKTFAAGLGTNREENEKALLRYVTLWLKHAYWQIDVIRDRGFKPLIVLDEPLLPTYMGQSGSAQSRKTLKLLRSIIKRLKRHGAAVGIHCCNRISPTTLIELGVDLIHFNAYHFPTQVGRTRPELQSFLRDGGVIAWGVVPVGETLTAAGNARIEKMLNDLLASMESRGLPLRRVLAQSMVAPTCGTGVLTAEQGDKVFSLAVSLSLQLKNRYKL